MGGRLEGKRALITGAGQGMGRATALAFAKEGAEVIATSRTAGKMADLPQASSAIEVHGLDVADADAISRLAEAVGPLDILVNCAGWVADGPLVESSDDDWMRSWEVNVMGPMRLIRATLPAMRSRGAGSIVNVASVASSVTGVNNRAAYGATKAALIGLTKSVARDHISEGIRCNVLCPGTTATPSLDDRIAATPDPEATRRSFTDRQPMGRLGTVEEMASAILWMASDEAGFMTGEIVTIDGGQTL
ncbi:2-keto-3-deoxy-L-fuconate dehydrogenase [Palleronia marisminoris]|uniref:2-keto-3-deoxy-L-fuconate dehydrogenase n=1 Tax=Palleronia marisminoris TaxID=315423 RepID=A0A1Y5SCW5_9RHOB|nr:SDR family oxidoreductase [Palleronia marisminoris]SFG73352.1 2-keto-3-deoxy-L-fuconate dehydrogenase [Palleronia marisminoris]SLN37514.1 2-keto-3-deoxy-L-fuconate dehydrogenase [Palleronia marisminoris]